MKDETMSIRDRNGLILMVGDTCHIVGDFDLWMVV